MPEEVLADLAQSQVSIYAASAGPGELKARIQMTDVVNRHRLRHGHMVGITKQIMREGMRADFAEVDALSERLIARARAAREIRVTSPGGTDLVATFSPQLKWIKTSGLITTAKWGNLPGGERFRARMNTLESAEAQFAALADFFDALAVEHERLPDGGAPEDLSLREAA